MSILNSYESSVITTFPGADLLRASEDKGNKAQLGALLAKNVEFLADGSVITRRGFALFQTFSIPVTRMFNWIVGSFNRLLVFSTNSGAPKVIFKGLDPGLPQNDVVTGINADAIDSVQAPFGSRWFMAFIKTGGVDGSATRAKVWNGLFDGGDPIVDDVFQPPLDDGTDLVVTPTEPGAGSVTAGEHKFALVYLTRNGYQTKADETDTPITSSGALNILLTLNPTGNWPDWVSGVRVAMTTVQNPSQFIFVGGTATIVGGTAGNILITIDIDDTVLASSVDISSATDWFSLLTNADQEAPDTPTNLLEYSNRMVWIAQTLDFNSLTNITTIWVSDSDDPQRMAADRNFLHLPGQRLGISAGVIQDVLFIMGPQWTYAFIDNNDNPVTWAPPHLVDSRIGTPSIHGVTASPSRGVLWVASRDGLYPFDGSQYPQRPTSYQQAEDWDRINWDEPSKIQVMDDGIHDTVHVLAPLDAATEPSHWLSWNYKRGAQWFQTDYSINDFDSFSPGCFQVVQNPATLAPELMLGNSAAGGQVHRQKSSLAGDASLYNDAAAAIDSEYRSPPLFGILQTPVRIRAAHVRTAGAGDLGVTVYNASRSRSLALTDITPVDPPESDHLRLFQMESEGCFMGIDNSDTADRWFSLTRIIIYFAPWISRR